MFMLNNYFKLNLSEKMSLIYNTTIDNRKAEQSKRKILRNKRTEIKFSSVKPGFPVRLNAVKQLKNEMC